MCAHTIHTHIHVVTQVYMYMYMYSRWPHSFLQDDVLHTAYISYFCVHALLCAVCFASDSTLILRSHGVSKAVKHDAALNLACAVAVVCSEGCKVRSYPSKCRKLPVGY